MLKNDRWIKEQSTTNQMIAPFVEHLTRKDAEENPVISYGLSSYGYDIRLSPLDFRVFRHIPGTIVDPKNFNPANLEKAELLKDENGLYFVLPANSYGLGVAIEKLIVPRNITIVCVGKSTYARCGIIANICPAEAAWEGHLTLEFSNSSSTDCRIYCNEGVVQLLFLEGEECETSYSDRSGKYQGQPEQVILAKV